MKKTAISASCAARELPRVEIKSHGANGNRIEPPRDAFNVAAAVLSDLPEADKRQGAVEKMLCANGIFRNLPWPSPFDETSHRLHLGDALGTFRWDFGARWRQNHRQAQPAANKWVELTGYPRLAVSQAPGDSGVASASALLGHL